MDGKAAPMGAVLGVPGAAPTPAEAMPPRTAVEEVAAVLRALQLRMRGPDNNIVNQPVTVGIRG